MKEIIGILDDFNEMGTEGSVWMVYDNCPEFETKSGNYDRLNEIEEGDYLIVYDVDGSVFWEGEIQFAVTESSYAHWFQEGVDEVEWITMFRSKARCLLRKK